MGRCVSITLPERLRACAACVLLLAACAGGSSGKVASGSPGVAGGAAGAAGAAGGTPDAFGNAEGPPTLAGTAENGLDQATLHGCNDLTVDFAPVVPTVMLVLDRSGSMFDMPYAGSATRWAALDAALMADASGVSARFQHEVRFGMMTYTSDFQAGSCPILRSVAPALDNHDAMRALYDEESVAPAFKAETPTGAGLRAAIAELLAVPGDDPRQLLLVTDGEPDDCRTPDPQCGQNESIEAVQDAYAMGIGTSVVGISNDVSARHLQDLANAGQGLPVQAPDIQYTYNCVNPGFATLGAQYAAADEVPGAAPIYQPADQAGLEAALETLIRGVAGCSFELNGEVDLERADLGTVLLDGQNLLYDDAHGWRMQSTRVLELVGDACARVQTNSQQLVISFPCDVVELL